MRFRFPSYVATKQFIQELENEHIGWQYGRKRIEVYTGKLPAAVLDVAESLKAEYDNK